MECTTVPNQKIKRHASLIRGPHQVVFDITNKCNLRCLHCFNRSAENSICNRELSDKDVIALFKDLAKFRLLNICLCGGEPLLKKDLIIKIVPIVRNVGTTVSMVTNGILLDAKTAHELKNVGMERIQISLDGKNKESHERLRQKEGSFADAIRAINTAVAAGFKDVAVAFTPTRFNIDEVEDVFKMCNELGVGQLRLQPLMGLGRARENIKDIEATQMQYRRIVGTINRLKHLYGIGRLQWGDPVDHLIRFRTVIAGLVNQVLIRANGDIVPSSYLPLSVGNIKKYSIIKYWENGLVRIWEANRVKEIATNFYSNNDLGKKEKNLPEVWFDDDINLDLIDNNLLN